MRKNLKNTSIRMKYKFQRKGAEKSEAVLSELF